MNAHLNREMLERELLALQQLYKKMGITDYKTRVDQLNKLVMFLQTFVQEMAAAISEDFSYRCIEETKLLDITPSISTIRYIKSNLRSWMRSGKRKIPWYLQVAAARVDYQPLGVVGIIVPFNYPLQLLFTPLAYALAAGNVCMVNISEQTPTFGELVKRRLDEFFPDGAVRVINGDLETAKTFSTLPFAHLFFTGSTIVAKAILRNAAENLVPTTLELGGKSPTMIAPDYPLIKALDKILYSKLVNAGQTCIASDYLVLAEQQLSAFVDLAKQTVIKFYPDFWNNKDYSHIISTAHYQRLQYLLADAQDKGATLIPLVPEKPTAREDRCFPPCLLINVTDTMAVMQEEIFGPILPVLTYAAW